jgi:hypothetical protein
MTTAFGKQPHSPRGRWWVVAVATGAMQLSYWPTILVSVQADLDPEILTAGLVVGLSAVPFVFMVVAFSSRHPRAPRAVLQAMGLFLVVAVPLGLLHVASGMAGGYAAGGSAALRVAEEAPSRSARIAMVVAIVFSVTLLVAVARPVGIVLGALLPFTALELADRSAERRTRD